MTKTDSNLKICEDLYPSRNLTKPQMQKRVDPVVWGETYAKGPLSNDKVRDFDRNGYLFFEKFFSEKEVNQFLKEFERLKNVNELKEAPEIIREPGNLEVRSIFYIHKISSLFKKVAADPRIFGMAKQILNSDVYIHQSRINLKPGFTGKEFYWHSDFETWHVEDGMPRMRAVSCCITLTENNEFNGPLMVIPGSQWYFVACPGNTPEDHYKQSLKKQEYGVPDTQSMHLLAKQSKLVAPKGPAGSLLLFDCNIMHGSNSNISPFPRSNLFLCYNSIENKLEEPFSSMKPRPEFIGSRDFTPIENKDV